jgi:hypothetical protein
MGFRSGFISLKSGLEEGELWQGTGSYRFALFEADSSG